MAQYKTFKDLVFQPHPTVNGLIAMMNFPNGYGISVIRIKKQDIENTDIPPQLKKRIAEAEDVMISEGLTLDDFYNTLIADNDKVWTVGVLKNGKVCYDTPITNYCVLNNINTSEVSEIMIKIQQLSPNHFSEN